jgi:ferritin-like protein
MKRSRSVRAYVIRLVVAVAVPLLAFEAFLLIRSADNEQRAIATTVQERAQGAAADLDRELRNLHDLSPFSLPRSPWSPATSPCLAAMRSRRCWIAVWDSL